MLAHSWLLVGACLDELVRLSSETSRGERLTAAHVSVSARIACLAPWSLVKQGIPAGRMWRLTLWWSESREEREHPSVVTQPTFTQPPLLCFPAFPVATKAWISRQTNKVRALDVQPCAQSLPLNTNAPESKHSTSQATLKNQLEASFWLMQKH